MENKVENGHCDIPTKSGSLGFWINHQRTLFRSKKLKKDRYEKLVRIGFAFEDARFANSKTKSEHEKWNILFMELVEYKDKNGNCNCPTRNGSLGFWINRQRTFFKSKKLKKDRYEKLVGIGFALKDDRSQKWLDMYQKLLEYKETKGHCFDVPSILPLGRWLREQRLRCRNGKLRESEWCGNGSLHDGLLVFFT